MVRPATEPFRTFLDDVTVKPPQIPVYSNSTATVYPSAIEEVRETLARQIALPVRFVEQIEAMYAAGVRTFLEVGPGTVLSSLVKSCLGKRPHNAISLDRKGQHGLTNLWHALGQLAVAGVSMHFARLWDGVACGDDPRRPSGAEVGHQHPRRESRKTLSPTQVELPSFPLPILHEKRRLLRCRTTIPILQSTQLPIHSRLSTNRTPTANWCTYSVVPESPEYRDCRRTTVFCRRHMQAP